MALIGNEYRYAKKILTGAVKESNLFKALVILTKYFYFELGQTEDELKRNLLIYIKGVGGVVDDKTLDSIIKINTSDKVHINTLDSITISATEWNTIQELGRTERERKLLFTLLCNYKVKMGLGYTDNKMVKVDYSKLNSMAHVTFTVEERIEALRYFWQTGLIDLHMGAMANRIELKYVHPEGKQMIVIKDFESFNVYYDYLKKGGRLFTCRECGKLVLTGKGKQYNSVKYCKDCAKIKENESKTEYDRTKRVR